MNVKTFFKVGSTSERIKIIKDKIPISGPAITFFDLITIPYLTFYIAILRTLSVASVLMLIYLLLDNIESYLKKKKVSALKVSLIILALIAGISLISLDIRTEKALNSDLEQKLVAAEQAIKKNDDNNNAMAMENDDANTEEVISVAENGFEEVKKMIGLEDNGIKVVSISELSNYHTIPLIGDVENIVIDANYLKYVKFEWEEKTEVAAYHLVIISIDNPETTFSITIDSGYVTLNINQLMLDGKYYVELEEYGDDGSIIETIEQEIEVLPLIEEMVKDIEVDTYEAEVIGDIVRLKGKIITGANEEEISVGFEVIDNEGMVKEILLSRDDLNDNSFSHDFSTARIGEFSYKAFAMDDDYTYVGGTRKFTIDEEVVVVEAPQIEVISKDEVDIFYPNNTYVNYFSIDGSDWNEITDDKLEFNGDGFVYKIFLSGINEVSAKSMQDTYSSETKNVKIVPVIIERVIVETGFIESIYVSHIDDNELQGDDSFYIDDILGTVEAILSDGSHVNITEYVEIYVNDRQYDYDDKVWLGGDEDIRFEIKYVDITGEVFWCDEEVIVRDYPLKGDLILEEEKLRVSKGERFRLYLEYEDESDYEWYTNDDSIVKSLGNGEFTAIGLGETIVYVTDGSRVSECLITVSE